jgi:peptidoglycan-associated lipoprotein
MRSSLALSVIATLSLGTACSGNKQAATPAERSVAEVKKPAAAPAKPAQVELTRSDADGAVVDYTPVYFGFDSAQLQPDARARLDRMAQALRRDPSLRLTIEGYCDERGTTEYNMSLGERRAQATRDYLQALGVDAAQLRSVSYGEERPASQGQDDEAYARNRRSEFVPQQQGRPTASR